MKRRELLKLLPSAGGMVFVGTPKREYPPTRNDPHTVYRIQSYVVGGDAFNSDVRVYNHETGEQMKWLVKEFTYHIGIEGSTRIQLRYVDEDGATGGIEMGPYGFVMDRKFEGREV